MSEIISSDLKLEVVENYAVGADKVKVVVRFVEKTSGDLFSERSISMRVSEFENDSVFNDRMMRFLRGMQAKYEKYNDAGGGVGVSSVPSIKDRTSVVVDEYEEDSFNKPPSAGN